MFFLIAFCLSISLNAQDSGGGTAPDSGFEEVEVNLAGQHFNKTLPFDVPFLIHGTLPTGTKNLEVRCWRLNNFHGTKKQRKSGEPVVLTEADKKEKEKNADGNCWVGGPLRWRNRNTVDPAAQNLTFRVVAPRLDAESYYTFEFLTERQVTPEQAAAFAQKVQEVVNRVLWGDPRTNPRISSSDELPLRGGLESKELEAVYQELVSTFEGIIGDDRIVEPGTLFSEDMDAQTAAAEFNVVLRPLREDQSQIVDRIDNYRNRVANATPLLRQVRSNPTLEKLQQALATADPSVQHHAQTISRALLSVPDLPVLGSEVRSSQETLAAFVVTNLPVVTSVDEKLSALVDLLRNKLFESDGSPSPFLKPLVDATVLTATDLDELRKLRDVSSPSSRAARLVDDAASLLQVMQRLLGERTIAVAAVADRYRTQVVGRTVVAGTTTGSFATQHKNYVSADTGLAYAPELEEFPTYVGTNIYFRPVNKAAPLDQFGAFFSRPSLARRLSFTIGLTVQGVGDNTTREDLFNQQSLILGLGARMTSSIRLTLGGLVFMKMDPDPLVDDDEENITPFLSLSFDMDVVPTLQGIGSLFRSGTTQQ